MYKISKTFNFAMGHRLSLHDGLCKNIHGHNYKLIVGLKSTTLNRSGMVMDFGDLKEIVNHHIKQFDHATMFNKRDYDFITTIQSKMPFLKIIYVDFEPTAENMAREFYNYFQEEIKKYAGDAEVDYITLYETDGSEATYCEN